MSGIIEEYIEVGHLRNTNNKFDEECSHPADYKRPVCLIIEFIFRSALFFISSSASALTSAERFVKRSVMKNSCIMELGVAEENSSSRLVILSS